MGNRKVICALDTADLGQALDLVKKLAPHVGAFKIGHALTLSHGLNVVQTLQDAGASRIFLDLKFHDIPNSVALAVREAARRHVWMLTLHIAGGPAMMSAAAAEAEHAPDGEGPLLMGVSVLTSLDQQMLTEQLGVARGLEEHMIALSKLAVNCGLDGVISSPEEVAPIRRELGHRGIIVSPGIRLPSSETHDQTRVGTAEQALRDGADYLVVGRVLTSAADPEAALASLGLGSICT